MDLFNKNVTLNVAIDAILFLFLFIIFLSCIIDSNLRKEKTNRYYILWLGFVLINLIVDSMNILVFHDVFNSSEFLKKICIGFYFFDSVIGVIPIYFWVVDMVKAKTTYQAKFKIIISLLLIGIGIWFFIYCYNYQYDIVYISSSSSDDQINTYYSAFSIIYQVALSILVISKRRYLGQSEIIFILLAINIVPLFKLNPWWETRPSNIAMAVFLILIYVRIWNQRRIELAESETELTKAKVQLMISQIQPHFLYNTLNSISSLCTIEPLQAKELTIMFANYLRGNLNAIAQTSTIPFEKELDHTKIYLKIEQTRFKDRLNIVYDIDAKDFYVPALSLQPLVENAVKHGICKKEDGGTLTIKTSETSKYFIIEIIDDGVGFDITKVDFESGTHVGLTNVKERLNTLCNQAWIEIDSDIGVGTNQKIVIPKLQRGKK